MHDGWIMVCEHARETVVINAEYFLFLARRPGLVPSCYLRLRLDCFKEKAVWIERSTGSYVTRQEKMVFFF